MLSCYTEGSTIVIEKLQLVLNMAFQNTLIPEHTYKAQGPYETTI